MCRLFGSTRQVWADNSGDLYSIGTMNTYTAYVRTRDDGRVVAARDDSAVEAGGDLISHSLTGADPPADPLRAAD